MKINNFFLGSITALLLILVSCVGNKQLSDTEIDLFIESYFDAQTFGENKVEAFNNTLSDSLIGWANAAWAGAPSPYDKANTDADWFYEDSITYELHDVMMVGSEASGWSAKEAGSLHPFSIKLAEIPSPSANNVLAYPDNPKLLIIFRHSIPIISNTYFDAHITVYFYYDTDPQF